MHIVDEERSDSDSNEHGARGRSNKHDLDGERRVRLGEGKNSLENTNDSQLLAGLKKGKLSVFSANLNFKK